MYSFDDDAGPIQCSCEKCGRTFERGSEEDNEKLCPKCERLEFITRDDYEDMYE